MKREAEAPPTANGGNATPVAARIASAHGLDVDAITGSGPRGRVTKEDVLAAVEGNGGPPAAAPPAGAEVEPIRGPAATLVKFMNDSRSIPTATSFRTVPVDLLDARRKALKESGKKLSFTHLIAWAIVQAARDMPVMGHAYAEEDGKPQRVDARHRQPRPGRGRGAQGRHPLARRAGAARRERARLRRLRGALRRAGRGRARQHAPARRLPGREHHAHQSRRDRHRRQRSAADARPGHDRRDRRDRLPARPHRRRPGEAQGHRGPEGHDDDLDLRPPRDPGRGVGRLPAPHRPAAPGRGRLLRDGLRGARRRRRPRTSPSVTAAEPVPAAAPGRRRPWPTPRCSRRSRRPPRSSRRTACTATWRRGSTRSAPSPSATPRSSPPRSASTRS